MVDLISAFLATPRPGPGQRARTAPGWPDQGAAMRRQCPEPAANWRQEHVTMTAEPSQNPVTEAVRSLEVRWIFPGQLETTVAVLPEARPYLKDLPFLADSGYEAAGAGGPSGEKARPPRAGPGHENPQRTAALPTLPGRTRLRADVPAVAGPAARHAQPDHDRRHHNSPHAAQGLAAHRLALAAVRHQAQGLGAYEDREARNPRGHALRMAAPVQLAGESGDFCLAFAGARREAGGYRGRKRVILHRAGQA